MYCKKCGNKLPDNAKFCNKCGQQVNAPIKKEEKKIEPPKLEQSKPPVSNQNNTNTNIKTIKSIDINKILVGAIAVVVLIIGLVVVSGTRISNPLNMGKSRTIMIYMVGSNLESKSGLATRDLQDLDYNKINANNNKVVLIAGGTEAWRNNYISQNETSIYELKENGFVKVDSRSLNNMGASDNLLYFLNYVSNNYQSDKYNFIFWNHGGAVDGSEYDDLSHDNLKLKEMDNAFSKSKFKGNNKLETISFRTCLNGTIEVANIYKKYAKYLVASEEVTIGSKADSAIRFINEVSPSENGESFGRKQIDTYKEVVTNTCNYTSTTTLAEPPVIPVLR